MVFNPNTKIGQTKKFKSFYSGPHIICEIINGLNFVIEDVKTETQQIVHYDWLKGFNSWSATTDKKKLTRQRLNQEYHKITLWRTAILWKLRKLK